MSVLCGEDVELPPELHRDSRPRSHVSSGDGRLLAGDSAAYGVKLQAEILGGFDRAAHRFADEGRDFDSALLDVEDYGSGRRGICQRVRAWRLWRSFGIVRCGRRR